MVKSIQISEGKLQKNLNCQILLHGKHIPVADMCIYNWIININSDNEMLSIE